MYRVTLLGRFRVDGPDGPVGGSAARGRHLALLTLLAWAGDQGMARERITALLWPEADAERARHSLEQVVYVLRRGLGADALATGGPMLALDGSRVASDLAEFLAATGAHDWERAVSLYGGPLLDAFHLSGAAEFERWLDDARLELHRCYTAALTRIAEGRTVVADHAGAAETWRRLAAAEPLSAPFALGLMRSLDAAGDRSAALTAARVHEQLLRQELDAAPDPDVARLAEQLRERPDRSERPERVGAGAGPSAPSSSALPSPSPVRRRRVVLAGAAAGAAIAMGAFAFVSGRKAPAAEPLPRVAVETFAGAADSVPEHAGRMAADWIRQGLARTGLVVVASDPAGADPLPTEGDARIAGRVYRVGDDLWFQAWISRPATGALLSTMDPVRAPLDDPVAALEPLRQQVLGAAGTLFDPRLADWADAALRPPTFEAYRAFVQGLEAFATGSLPAAVAEFRRAAALDPAYAQAYLWGAWSCVRMAALSCADSMTRAVEPLAGSLTPLEQAWHDRITAVLRGDGEASFHAAQRMVRLSPGSGWVMALHNAAMDTRRAQLAARTLREVGPDGLGLVGVYYWGSLARAHHALGEYDQALAVLDDAGRLGNRHPETLVALAATLAALGDTARIAALVAEAAAQPGLSGADVAEVVFTAGVELRAHGHPRAAAPLLDAAADRYQTAFAQRRDDTRLAGAVLDALHEAERWDDLMQLERAASAVLPEVDRLGLRGHAAARRGDDAAAAQASAELAALSRPFLFGAHHLWRARIAAEQGDPDLAIRLLQRAFASGSGREWAFLHYGRDFDRLRGHPGFQDLVRPRN